MIRSVTINYKREDYMPMPRSKQDRTICLSNDAFGMLEIYCKDTGLTMEKALENLVSFGFVSYYNEKRQRGEELPFDK